MDGSKSSHETQQEISYHCAYMSAKYEKADMKVITERRRKLDDKIDTTLKLIGKKMLPFVIGCE